MIRYRENQDRDGSYGGLNPTSHSLKRRQPLGNQPSDLISQPLQDTSPLGQDLLGVPSWQFSVYL